MTFQRRCKKKKKTRVAGFATFLYFQFVQTLASSTQKLQKLSSECTFAKTYLKNSYCHSHRASTIPPFKPWWLILKDHKLTTTIIVCLSQKQNRGFKTSSDYLRTRTTCTSLPSCRIKYSQNLSKFSQTNCIQKYQQTGHIWNFRTCIS